MMSGARGSHARLAHQTSQRLRAHTRSDLMHILMVPGIQRGV
jgi:hypothetical protein